MHQAHDEQEPAFVYRLMTTLLLLGLLVEWLIPWVHAGEWSQLLQPKPLIWMTVVMLALGLTRPRLLWFIAAGVIVGLVAMFLVYRGEGQTIGQYLLELVPSLGRNFNDMLKFGIWYMSDEFRTLLLFTGWLLLAPALQSMVWYYQLSLSLVAATIMYLIVLHLSLGFNVWLGLLRVIGEGLLLIALATLLKLQRYQFVLGGAGRYRYQIASVLVLSVAIVAGGMLASDSKEKRSEPIAWTELFSDSVTEELVAWSQQASGIPLKNVTSSNYSGSSVAVSGYDSDDSELGQTLRPSNEVVFYGWSPQPGYWRAETKATYTGKGWGDQGGAVTLHKIADGAESAAAELGSKGKREQIEQKVAFIEPIAGMPLLQSGTKGVVLELQASNPERELSSYIAEPATGALYPPVTDAAIKGYTVLTELPVSDPALLNELAERDEELAQRAWESDMLQPYLQLPEQLPERVAALAAEVSGGGWTSRYDQVKAIEQYLKENYTYSLKSKMPGENEDFVDHFLFEQQKGYCVHFATAMVVMLRSQEIPARWVKGYQTGEAVGEQTNAAGIVETQYKVREQDAHAWVEVYFPEAGWVPFDPTPAAAEQQASAWLGDLDQLGGDIWGELKRWSALLSTKQWQWLAVAAAAAVGALLAVAAGWSALRRRMYLSRYARAYKQLKQDEQLLQLSCSFPSRNKKRLAMQRLARDRQPHLQQRLQHAMECLVDQQLSSLERKAAVRQKVKQPNKQTAKQTMEHPAKQTGLTWRQRIEAVSVCSTDQVQREQLAALLSSLERMQYSMSMTAPAPDELRQQLLALRPGRLLGMRLPLRLRRSKARTLASQSSASVSLAGSEQETGFVTERK